MARIAFLFSGLPRQWSHCVGSQLALFPNHETDVFFHFWDTVDAAEKQQIVDAYQPKAHRFEPQINFTPWEAQFPLLDNINSPSRIASMYYSWSEVAGLFRRYQRESGVHYDFLVRLRADLMFFNPLEDLLRLVLPNDLLISNFNDFNLINDMFALGGPAPILYYHSLYDKLLTYKNEVHCNPEHLLIHHLKRNGLGMRIVTATVVMLVFRPHMVGMSIEDCLKQHPGASKWKDPEIVDAHKGFHGRRQGDQGVRHVEEFQRHQLKHLDGN